MQQYSKDNDNEGSNVPMNQGQYANLDEMSAGANGYDSALEMASAVARILAAEEYDIIGGEPVVTMPVTLTAGSAMVITMADYEGVEYELFVRVKP